MENKLVNLRNLQLTKIRNIHANPKCFFKFPHAEHCATMHFGVYGRFSLKYLKRQKA